MNFDDAIKAHTEWKTKLRTYLRRPDGSLKAPDIAPDNKCALGQWIYGEGAKYHVHPEFNALKTEHAKFHKAAAEVVRLADSGDSVTEATSLGSSSPFDAASTAVIQAIIAIKRRAK